LEAVWDREWANAILRAALKRLQQDASPKHFQIFYLHVIRELPPEKVAGALGVNVGEIYTVKHRLSSRFKAILQQVESFKL